MKLQPWHGFLAVAILTTLGHGLKFADAADLGYHVAGTLLWASIAAGAIYFITRPKTTKETPK